MKKKVNIPLIFHTSERLSMHYLSVYLAFGPFIKISRHEHTECRRIKLEYRVSKYTHVHSITAEYEIDVENSVFHFMPFSLLRSTDFFLSLSTRAFFTVFFQFKHQCIDVCLCGLFALSLSRTSLASYAELFLCVCCFHSVGCPVINIESRRMPSYRWA